MTDAALRELRPALDALYPRQGRPSVPPEQLLRALLLQVLYSIRSERMLIEQLEYNLLFRWFVGLAMDAEVWVPTTFTKNRVCLLDGEIAARFFDAVTRQAETAGLLSDEHFTVDGSLLQAWASHKSVKPIGEDPPASGGGRNVDGNFRGQRRRNETHRSTTDADARLARKGNGQAEILGYYAHVLFDNRHGPCAQRLRHTRDGHRRSRGGRAASRDDGPSGEHGRRRQGLRPARVCGARASTGDHAARRRQGARSICRSFVGQRRSGLRKCTILVHDQAQQRRPQVVMNL